MIRMLRYNKYKINIVLLILLILIFILYYNINKKNNSSVTLHNWWTSQSSSLEEFTDISLHNWWSQQPSAKENDFFKEIFSNILHKYDNINIYSLFGDFKKFENKKNILTVQYSGEVNYNDPNLFNINIIPGIHPSNKNVIVIPHMYIHCYVNNLNMNNLTIRRRLLEDKKEFCLFSVSNPNSEKRIDFFKQLSKYKKVNSCGKVLNNTGYNCPGNHDSDEYRNYISQYKFMICFENSSLKNYLTEKLVNAYISGTIPIYWGCPNVEDYIDISSILYLRPDYTQEELQNIINEIIALDNSPELYKKKYESIFFKDGKIPDEFNINKIKEKIKKITNDQ